MVYLTVVFNVLPKRRSGGLFVQILHIRHFWAEPVFLNVYGAQESIPKNEFRQPM